MTRQAHITSRPNYEVGDRVLGLCGKEFKVKVKWADLPDDKPICRPCVDSAVAALTEADGVIESVRIDRLLLAKRYERMGEVLDQTLLLDTIADMDQAFQAEQDQQAREAAEELVRQQTCICAWTSPEIFEENPDCPIHGGELDAIGVEITEDPEPTDG